MNFTFFIKLIYYTEQQQMYLTNEEKSNPDNLMNINLPINSRVR